LAFIGHDAGHRQVVSSRRGNQLIGLVHANLLTGFSFGWWLAKHNRHHAQTNRVGKDPDIGPGALTFTPEQTLGRSRVGRYFARTQGAMLAPLLLGEAINLHVSSIIAVVRRRDRSALIESALLAIHFGVFFAGPFLLWDPWHAAAFVAVSQALFGFYLGATFVTNHVGMPVLSGSDDLGFLRRQVLTSRNLSGGRAVAFFSGGLSLQVEHHLFPHMPRANLLRARSLVRSYCADIGVYYHEQHPLAAYCDVIRNLHAAGAGRAVSVIN
jgi:fatty acid desaturase